MNGKPLTANLHYMKMLKCGQHKDNFILLQMPALGILSIHKNVSLGGHFLSTVENATDHQSPKCPDHKPPVPVNPGKAMLILFPSQTRQQMTMCFDLLTIGVGSG